MTLKRSYTIAFSEELSKQIEKYKEATGKTYTQIFKEGIKLLLNGEDNK